MLLSSFSRRLHWNEDYSTSSEKKIQMRSSHLEISGSTVIHPGDEWNSDRRGSNLLTKAVARKILALVNIFHLVSTWNFWWYDHARKKKSQNPEIPLNITNKAKHDGCHTQYSRSASLSPAYTTKSQRNMFWPKVISQTFVSPWRLFPPPLDCIISTFNAAFVWLTFFFPFLLLEKQSILSHHFHRHTLCSMSTVSKTTAATPWNKTMSHVQNEVSCPNIGRSVAWPKVIWLLCKE